jgi:hypothetical protein
MTDHDDDEIHVTFRWEELQALIRLCNASGERTGPVASAWAKLADAHQANDPPERTYR